MNYPLIIGVVAGSMFMLGWFASGFYLKACQQYASPLWKFQIVSLPDGGMNVQVTKPSYMKTSIGQYYDRADHVLQNEARTAADSLGVYTVRAWANIEAIQEIMQEQASDE